MIPEEREAAWFAVHDALPPGWRVGRWRRLSRCYEGSPASARAWLEVASVGYLSARLRVEPT